MIEEPSTFEEKWSDEPFKTLIRERPLGITILAILQIIGVILYSIILFMKPDLIVPSYLISDDIYLTCMTVTVVFLILSLIIAVGLLKGFNWARIITIIFQAISIGISVISFNILGIIVSGYIIYYLTRPYVKEYFLLD